MSSRDATQAAPPSDDTIRIVRVPFQQASLAPPPRERVRRLRRHLIAAMRDLRVVKRPERLLRPAPPEPTGFAALVAREGCAQCQGHCCRGGGEHAYIDEGTMARVRRDRPELDARAVLRLYVDSVAPLAYEGSCLFHGARGCTLDRALRADLCNRYYCDGLSAFLKQPAPGAGVVVVAARDGSERRSEVLRPEA